MMLKGHFLLITAKSVTGHLAKALSPLAPWRPLLVWRLRAEGGRTLKIKHGSLGQVQA